MILKKIKTTSIAAYSAAITMIATNPVLAAGGITAQTADDVSNKVTEVVNGVVQPIGALLIFLALGYTAIKFITTANKPNERAEVMGSIPYILGGALLLGGLLLFSGFMMDLMTKIGA